MIAIKRLISGVTAAILLFTQLMPIATAFEAIQLQSDEQVYNSNYELVVFSNHDADFEAAKARLNSGSWVLLESKDAQTQTYSADFTLIDGDNTFEVKSYDIQDQDEPALESATFTINYDAFALISAREVYTDEYELEVQVPGVKANEQVQYKVGSDDWANMLLAQGENYVATINELAEGTNTIQVRRYNTTTSTAAASDQFVVTYYPISLVSDAQVSDADYDFHVTVPGHNEDVNELEYRLNGGTWQPLTRVFETNDFRAVNLELTQGENMFEVRETSRFAEDALREASFTVEVTELRLVSARTTSDQPYILRVEVPDVADDSYVVAGYNNTDTSLGQLTREGDSDIFRVEIRFTEDRAAAIYVAERLSDGTRGRYSVFNITYTQDEDIIQPWQQFDVAACEFVDVNWRNLYSDDNDIFEAVKALCEDKGWVTGDDQEVTIDNRTGKQVRLFESINRAEFTKILVAGPGGINIDNLDKNIASVFYDVAVSQWYTGIIRYAYAQEWITGFLDDRGRFTGQFGPSRDISVAEAVVLTLRVADVDVDGYYAEHADQLPDNIKVSEADREWMRDAITYAVVNDLIKINYYDVDFAASAITRANSFYMLHQLLEAGDIN